MSVTSGALEVKLPGDDNWTPIAQHESFVVEAGQKFGARCTVETAYLCLYR